MNLSQNYAQALFEAIEKEPKNSTVYMNNLVEVLKRHDHIKLLPQIFAAFETLELAKSRSAEQRKVTPQQEQNRILLELYRKLISVT